MRKMENNNNNNKIYIRWRKIFVQCKTGKKKKIKKINFINLFGYEVKKIIF